MKLFTVFAYVWKAIFHVIALYLSFKHSFDLGLIMVSGIVLHNVLTLIVMQGKTIKSTIVDKQQES